MKGLRTAAASAAVIILSGAGGAYAADLGGMPVKALPAGSPAMCSSIMDFFTTACQVAAYGVRFYGTIDMGFGHMTNGSSFSPLGNVNFFPGKPSLGAKWLPEFNALTPSNIGLQVKEPLGGGWSFVGQVETGFLPNSAQLLNGVHSLATQVGIPLVNQNSAGDSNSQGAFYNGLGFAGVSHDIWGTLTFFRQNSLGQDLYLAYDPMGLAPSLSVPGFFGGFAGQGDTENRKDTTAIKYRVNIANWHVGAYGQVGGYNEGNAAKGAIQGNIGADFNVGPGVFSTDVVGSFRKDAVSLSLGQALLDPNTGLGVANEASTLSATITNNTSFILGTKYQMDKWKFYAGYEWTQFANASDQITSFTDIAGDVITSVKSTGTTPAFAHGDKIQQLVFTGARYALTDSIDVSGAYYHIWQNDFSGGVVPAHENFTCAQVSTIASSCAGTIDAVSALIDWKFAAKWDTYLGTNYSINKGGTDNGFLAKDNWSTTAGLRFRW